MDKQQATHADGAENTAPMAALPQQGTSPFGGRLILVRHGQTFGNVARALDTALPGQPLTELGTQQALDVGMRIGSFVTRGGPVALFTSEAVRAQQTGHLIAEGLARADSYAPRVIALPGIHEIAAGEIEGRTDEKSMRAYIDVVRSWMAGNHQPELPGGESFRSFHERWNPVLSSLAVKLASGGVWDGRDVIVVSHGAAIRTVISAFTITDPKLMAESMIANCGFVVMRPPAPGDKHWFVEGWDKISFWGAPGTAGG